MELASWQTSMVSWIAQADPSLTPVFSLQEEAPRPVRPFITIHTLSMATIGQPDRILTDTAHASGDYVGRVLEVWRGSVSLQIFADDAWDRMQDLIGGLDSSSIQELLLSLSLTISPPSTLRDLTSLAGTSQERRIGGDFFISYMLDRSYQEQAITGSISFTDSTLDP